MSTIPTFTDAAMSLWQSSIHAVIQKHDLASAVQLSASHEKMQQAVATGVTLVPDAAPARSADCAIAQDAELATKLALALASGNDRQVEELRNEFKYSDHDPLWSECLLEYEKSLVLRQQVPYRTYDPARIATDFVLPLPEPAAGATLTLAVIGDWGTGTEDARHLLAAVAKQQPDVLLHLGDIYYSGTQDECQHHFYDVVVAQWPGPDGPAIPAFTLAGNHDLYSGGAGFYHLLDQLHQPASFFCLRNDHWQILALDTSLHEHDVLTECSCVTFLEPSEVLWHQDKLLQAGTRKTILLSHHQLFSVVGRGIGQDADGHKLAINPNLYTAFSQNGASLQQVALWLWGHEHNLLAYEPYAGLARGRCLGAGAIPVGVAQDPYAVNTALVPAPGYTTLPQLQAAVRLGHDDEVYNRCYAVLSLRGDSAVVQYFEFPIDADEGQLLWAETIS